MDRVRTVGANDLTSRSHRTSARLTPISLADRSTARISSPTAYSPQSRGLRKYRASTTPVANVPTRMTTVFSRLHRAAETTWPPSSLIR